jgi:hypothetical protein
VHKGTAHKAGTIQTSRKNCDRQRNTVIDQLLITSSIAAEVFSALLASDPERAWRVSESVLLQHEKYRNDSCFPNIRDLLSTFSRIS